MMSMAVVAVPRAGSGEGGVDALGEAVEILVGPRGDEDGVVAGDTAGGAGEVFGIEQYGDYLCMTRFGFEDDQIGR